ncbi:MAG TPA: acyl-phosphate glycerol 3-phosphate acyltransferase [Clostridiales bacterium]|jgi:glycerol-3-phosphate acyltransferase PlsY|nr:acyl-phosphate glycerol 3-phosphate acyltransferase [Clostridiales bacterium]
MEYLVSAIVGYIIGCFQTSYLLGKALKQTDIREHGTSNAGASNAAIVFGWKYGFIIALVDIGKTILAVTIIGLVYPGDHILKYIAGLSCILGHIFPFYMQFKGGKGFASYAGLVMAINWRWGLAFIFICIIITVVTNYVSVAALVSTGFYPLYNIYIKENPTIILLLVMMYFVIIYKHRENISRLKTGQEKGLRDLLKKKTPLRP